MDDKIKVLIADDMELNRELLKEVLEGKYEILEARDGKEVISIIEHNRMNLGLILLDIYMPNMNGFEVLEYMKEHNYLEQIPVIVITVSDSEDTALKAYEYKVAEIIYKPFSLKIVDRRVNNVIELYEDKHKLEQFIMEEMEKEKPPYQALLQCNLDYSEKIGQVKQLCTQTENVQSRKIMEILN